MRALKVYRWQSFRIECPTNHRQTKEVVAARSKTEAARLAGFDRPSQMFNLAEACSDLEIKVAMQSPGTVYWTPIDNYNNEVKDWIAAPKEESTNET
jgi:hypothetical protein